VGDEVALLARVARVLNDGGVRYFVTGSVASMFYGEPRMTRDIDIVVHLRMGDVHTLMDGVGEPDFYLDKRSILDAINLEGQFNAIHHATGMKVDFMCSEVQGYNGVRFERARFVEFSPGLGVWMSAPEDLILKKLDFYKMGGSDKHLRDIASMIRVSGETFDRAYLDRWAETLGVREEWGAIKGRVGW
jgi:hypothetical protein